MQHRCQEDKSSHGSAAIWYLYPDRELTIVFVLHPGEGDSSKVALAEAQQERSGFSVLEQIPFHLFTHKSHDVAAWSNRETFHACVLVGCVTHHLETCIYWTWSPAGHHKPHNRKGWDTVRDSLGVPDWQQVLLNEVQDGVQPQPETERLPWDILLEECRTHVVVHLCGIKSALSRISDAGWAPRWPPHGSNVSPTLANFDQDTWYSLQGESWPAGTWKQRKCCLKVLFLANNVERYLNSQLDQTSTPVIILSS